MMDYSYGCQMLRVCIPSEFIVTWTLWLIGSEIYTDDCCYCQELLSISYKKKRSLSWAAISTLVCNYAGSVLRPDGTTWSFINWFLTTNSSLNSWVLPFANTRSVDIRLCSCNGKASQESQKCLEIKAYHCWSKKARPALRHLACHNKAGADVILLVGKPGRWRELCLNCWRQTQVWGTIISECPISGTLSHIFRHKLTFCWHLRSRVGTESHDLVLQSKLGIPLPALDSICSWFNTLRWVTGDRHVRGLCWPDWSQL